MAIFTDSDSEFSCDPGDLWTLNDVDSSLDPWSDEDLAVVGSLAVGHEIHLASRDVTVRRVQ